MLFPQKQAFSCKKCFRSASEGHSFTIAYQFLYLRISVAAYPFLPLCFARVLVSIHHKASYYDTSANSDPPAGRRGNLADIFFHLFSWYHNLMSTAHTFQPEICADPQNLPFKAAAGMLLF